MGGRLALGGHLDTCTFTIGHALEDVLFDIATREKYGTSIGLGYWRIPSMESGDRGIDFEGQLSGWEGTIMLLGFEIPKDVKCLL